MALHISTRALEKIESPRKATGWRTPKRAWQESQSTAFSIAAMISPITLALQATKKLQIRASLGNVNIVQVGRLCGRQSLEKSHLMCKAGREVGRCFEGPEKKAE
jgi:hypothetical protein